MQCVSGPTRERGRTLDLVLSYGLSVSDLEICDNVISDHMPVVFEVCVSPVAMLNLAPPFRAVGFLTL